MSPPSCEWGPLACGAHLPWRALLCCQQLLALACTDKSSPLILSCVEGLGRAVVLVLCVIRGYTTTRCTDARTLLVSLLPPCRYTHTINVPYADCNAKLVQELGIGIPSSMMCAGELRMLLRAAPGLPGVDGCHRMCSQAVPVDVSKTTHFDIRSMVSWSQRRTHFAFVCRERVQCGGVPGANGSTAAGARWKRGGAGEGVGWWAGGCYIQSLCRTSRD